jgi:hypothetical protein
MTHCYDSVDYGEEIVQCSLFIIPLFLSYSGSAVLTATISIIRHHMATRTANNRVILHQQIRWIYRFYLHLQDVGNRVTLKP